MKLGRFEDPVGCFAGPVSWGLPGHILPIWFIAIGVDHGLLAAVSVVGFLRQKTPLSPFPYCAGEEKVTARMCAVIMRFVSCQMTAKTDSVHTSVAQPRLTDEEEVPLSALWKALSELVAMLATHCCPGRLWVTSCQV